MRGGRPADAAHVRGGRARSGERVALCDDDARAPAAFVARRLLTFARMAKKKRAAELPSTVKRSSAKAQRTYAKTLDNAVEQYGEGERARRTAMASLKRGFEKRGDRWEPKKHGPGPSDPRSAQKSTAAKREGRGETFGGVDYLGSSKKELYERAKQLDIAGRASMTKRELARAIAKKQR